VDSVAARAVGLEEERRVVDLAVVDLAVLD
jgi:hypothetical protein